MEVIHIAQQCHGYKGGHQLLGGSLRLPRDDQDAVDRLSDISGPLRPGELFSPYLTAYSLPSGSHYVLARTWQDVNAKRSGCVLTRSLFLPAEAWAKLQDIGSLVSKLEPVNREDLRVEAFELIQAPGPMCPVPLNLGMELVESLFLEDRQPTVVFGSPYPEPLLLRILLGLWPGIRRTFSACTLALAPRAVSGRAFDLMFTTAEMRSRFARWTGRRIDGSGSRPINARHRWSFPAATRILQDPRPDLETIDTLGILRDDMKGEESRLRIALLWNELAQQLDQSPSAILGMLDILQSLHGSIDLADPKVVELIEKSIGLCVVTEPAKSLEFLVALIRKIGLHRLPIRLSRRLREAIRSSVAKSPDAALSFVEGNQVAVVSAGTLALSGFGDGFGSLSAAAAEGDHFDRLTDELLLNFLAKSRTFARMLLGLAEQKADWLFRIPRLLGFPDLTLSSRAKRNVLSVLWSDRHAPILAACLRGVDTHRLLTAARIIWRSTRFANPSFDLVFDNVCRATGSLDRLRDLIVSLPAENSERFLLSTFRGEPNDYSWVLSCEALSVRQRRSLLNELLIKTDKEQIYSLGRNRQLADIVLRDVPFDIHPKTAIRIAWLISSSDSDVEQALDITSRVLGQLEQLEVSELLNSVVSRGLRYAPRSSNSQIRSLMENALFAMRPDHLVANSAAPQSTTDRIGDNLVLLNEREGKWRRGILEHIDNLSHRLLQLRAEALHQDAIRAWASLITEARLVNPSAQRRAASAVLAFAFSHRHHPLSPLVTACFPVVYNDLREGRDPVPILLFFFTDWDRCKTARTDLVTTFLDSSWPAIDLVSAARPTGDLGEILKLVFKSNANRRFLHELNEAVRSLPEFEAQSMDEAADNP